MRRQRPFDYHKPTEAEVERIESVRNAYQECLNALRVLTSEGNVSGRYLSLAITDLESSCMWATKSIVFERENTDATR